MTQKRGEISRCCGLVTVILMSDVIHRCMGHSPVDGLAKISHAIGMESHRVGKMKGYNIHGWFLMRTLLLTMCVARGCPVLWVACKAIAA